MDKRGIAVILCVLFAGVSLTLLPARTKSVDDSPDQHHIVVSIYPIRMILQSLLPEDVTIEVLLPPGTSPHTFELKPSDAQLLAGADAVFVVDEVLDGWAARSSVRKTHRLLEALPEQALRYPADDESARHDHHDHHHGDIDPHFWMSPDAVRALLPPLTAKLCALLPEFASAISARAADFDAELQGIGDELDAMLRDSSPKRVILTHSSCEYLLERLGIEVVGYVEHVPGVNPGPQHMKSLIESAKQGNCIIVRDIQSPIGEARMLARTTGALLVEIDPIGGVAGLETYKQLILSTARSIVSEQQ